MAVVLSLDERREICAFRWLQWILVLCPAFVPVAMGFEGRNHGSYLARDLCETRQLCTSNYSFLFHQTASHMCSLVSLLIS